MARGPCAHRKELQDPWELELAAFLLKRPLIEKSIDAVAPSNAFVRELEETCINEPDLRFNIPKNMEESKVKFEYKPTFTAQSKRKQEQQMKDTANRMRLEKPMSVIHVFDGIRSRSSASLSANLR